MKVIHLAFSAGGGAGTAAGRSVRALREAGIEAEFWTANDSNFGASLRKRRWTLLRILLDGMPLRFYRRKKMFSAWSNNWQPSRLAGRVNHAEPDVVNLHWIGGGFLSLSELTRFRAPVVWTMHDTWAFTGGCHYPNQCRRFVAECGACPQLGSVEKHDVSWRNLRVKCSQLGKVGAFVSPSKWLGELAATSRVVPTERLHIVPYGLDGEVFRPRDRQECRKILGLDADAFVLVAGAFDLREARKGGHLIRDVIARAVTMIPRRFTLVLFGANGDAFEKDWPCEVRWLGTLREEADISRVCSAANVLLLPSLQDNFPNLALEAQACGCPVVGFDTGGLREIIEPKQTGWLADETTAASLANALADWDAFAAAEGEITAKIRARFEKEFTYAVHSRRMVALYESLLRENHCKATLAGNAK